MDCRSFKADSDWLTVELKVPANPPYLLPHANISWQSTDTPYAPDYEDVYWSASGGAEEKTHVFIKGCKLEARWDQLSRHDAFSIVELGFGFGLNFLLTLRFWQKQTVSGLLEYVSFEKHLVPLDEIRKMASVFGLEAEFLQLQRAYPTPVPGPHRIKISDNCYLTLVIGDATTQCRHLKGGIDAIYLDGFSPSKNEVLWQENIISQLARHLRPGGKLATYSVAGHLRRSLEHQGLGINKVPGYGSKRHMLVAEAKGNWSPNRFAKKHIAIVGAGLTGLFCADALEQRGHQVSVFDQTGKPLGAVSEIQQIAIYPQLSQTPQPYSNLYLRSFYYFLNHLELNRCGRLELLASEAEKAKAEALVQQLTPHLELLNPEQSSKISGFDIQEQALYLREAGWLSPQSVSPEREIRPGKLQTFSRQETGWQLVFDQHEETVDAVVLATGPETMDCLAPLGLMPLRGQSLRLSEVERSPACVLSGKKTWFPPDDNGTTTVSGTYSRFDSDLTIRETDNEELLEGIKDFVMEPNYTAQVGVRSATRDRMPIIGLLPDWQTLDIQLQAGGDVKKMGAYEQDIYLSLGFGSHAGTLGPYCAQLLTQIVSGDIQIEPMQQLDATRFAKRDGKVSST